MIFITKPEDRSGSSINRLLLIMKLIALLVSINITMVMGDGLAQTITLQVKDISLVEAMRSIQKQSGHSYFLKGKELRSEEHTSELQSRGHLVCRIQLEKKKTENNNKIQ